MTRVAKLWICLAVIYAALLAWHQPLRGPLTEAEVRAAFGPQFDQMRDSQDPQATSMLDFFLTDNGRPFFMINLNALPDSTAEIEDAARSYGAFMLPRLLSRASYPVLSSDVITGLNNSLGPDAARFERLIVVRYRSRRDLLRILTSPGFRSAVPNKHASLDGWYAAPATAGPVLSVPQVALIVLIGVGGLGTLLAGRPQTRRRPESRAL
ncbi:MAG: hypothetical protein AAGC86_01425 [Pseudomonadota bacterium]